jgi:hypothetical protein
MKSRFFAIISLSFVSVVFGAGDHFPIAQGNSWLFSYVKSSGGWGSVRSDSGTMQWQMLAVSNNAAPDTATAAIRRIFNLCRTKYNPGSLPEGGVGMAYDSVFSPPRPSLDTIYIKSGNLGVTFKGDTCWSFVHDPKGSLPSGRVSVRDTSVPCMGNTAAASIIDQSPCHSIYDDLKFYITVQGIGPVEYHNHSSAYLMDAFWSEDWKLITTNVNTSVKPRTKPVAAAHSLRMVMFGKDVIIEGLVARTGKLTVSFYNVKGAVFGKFETEISLPGLQHIKIPGKSFGAITSVSGPCIIKLLSPDHREITGKITKF